MSEWAKKSNTSIPIKSKNKITLSSTQHLWQQVSNTSKLLLGCALFFLIATSQPLLIRSVYISYFYKLLFMLSTYFAYRFLECHCIITLQYPYLSFNFLIYHLCPSVVTHLYEKATLPLYDVYYRSFSYTWASGILD